MQANSTRSDLAQLTPDEAQKMEEFVQLSFDFARQNDVESLKIMLDHGLSVNLANHRGDTLLMLASYNNAIESVRLLLDYGANIDLVNNRNQTPLSGALFKGYDEVCFLLIERGANIHTGTPSSLNCAIMFNRKKILDLMLKDTKLNFWQRILKFLRVR
ncbi:MAG: ankyrin repeat domain-containing protein [Helicobacter sp.]|nr:ankyrin repeat domain-containing protein [Helicobacter sp.]